MVPTCFIFGLGVSDYDKGQHIVSSVARGVQGVLPAPCVTPKGGDTQSYFCNKKKTHTKNMGVTPEADDTRGNLV